MTEQDWLTASDPEPMLKFLLAKPNERRLRLFALACCRSIWHLLGNPACRKAIEVAEMYADGLTSAEELEAAHNAAREGTRHDFRIARNQGNAGVLKAISFATSFATSPSASFLSDVSAKNAFGASYLYSIAYSEKHPIADWMKAWEEAAAVERRKQCGLIHEIFGNPFRSVKIHSTWLSPAVLRLAETTYGDRAFERMPILGDALEEAGCSNAEILEHCRGPGPHVRGCWLIDLLLRNE